MYVGANASKHMLGGLWLASHLGGIRGPCGSRLRICVSFFAAFFAEQFIRHHSPPQVFPTPTLHLQAVDLPSK